MSRVLHWVKLLAAVLVVIIAGALPSVTHADAIVRAHSRGFLAVTIGTGVVVLLLLVYAWIWAARTGGRAMTRTEFEVLAARTQILSTGTPYSAAPFRGRLQGVVTEPTGWTFGEIKIAWRSGVWRRDPNWHARFAGTAGGLLVLVGLFGSILVPSPPGVKVVLAGAVIYALARAARAFWRA